jgi:predicted nucleic acid-binding protein
VIDANLAVWLVAPVLVPPGIDVPARFTGWRAAGEQLAAPTLWMAECTSAIRSATYARALSSAQAQTALVEVFALPLDLAEMTPILCRAAFDWAGRLQQAKAYDGFYLALADQLGAEFWSADQRLVNGARQAGMSRAHWVGES